MARPRKPPAILVTATVRKSSKLAGLPSDTARLGFFYVVLAEAKLADPPGSFASAEHFRELAGRFGRYLPDYVKAGILEVAPRLCPKCQEKWSTMPPRKGAHVVHDWHDHQYDPRKLERQQAYDEQQRLALEEPDEDDGEPGVSDAVSDEKPAVSDAVSDVISDAKPGVSDAISDADSRAIARDRAPARAPDRVGPDASNVERRTTNGISHGEDRSPSAVREDIAALLERPGWTKVTRAQRKVLNEVLVRHDVTGARFAAEVIRNTPADRDPLEAVMAADRMWQDAERRRVEAEEQAWQREKAGERAEAGERIAWLTEQVAGR